jgi:hypothetical protein
MGNKWEAKYAEFKRCVEMPVLNSKLHAWQHNQLGNGHASLNAKIQKELAENTGRTVWSDRRERLDNCVGQKKRDTLGNK